MPDGPSHDLNGMIRMGCMLVLKVKVFRLEKGHVEGSPPQILLIFILLDKGCFYKARV